VREATDVRRPWPVVAWLLLAAGGLGVGLGGHALIDPDEGRSAAVARAMAATGDYLVPRLNGVAHLDKPVLFHAAQAGAMRLLGPTETAARLPALFATWATVASTVWFARGLFGRGAGWVAGTVSASAPLAVAMARTAIFDSMLSFFVVLATIAFFRAIESAPGEGAIPPARRWSLLAWGSMALGVLTKGPVALVVPLLVAGPYALWRRRSPRVWHVSGPVLFLLLVLPWALAVEQRQPGFLRYALVTETWRRVTTGELHRGGPIWYFLPYLLAGCFPWVLVVAVAAVERWRRVRPEERAPLLFLGLWLAVPLVFFSLSQSKRPQYVLPLVAAVALLTAWAWSAEEAPARAIRAGAVGWLLAGSLLNAVAAKQLGQSADGAAHLEALVRSTALGLGAVMLVGGTLAWLTSRRRDVALIALSLPAVLLPLLTQPLVAAVARERSAKELAAVLRSRLPPDARIVGVETFSPSLTFYRGEPIEVSSATGRPLASNYVLAHYARSAAAGSSTLHGPDWWRQSLSACSRPLVFLVSRHSEAARLTLGQAGLPVRYEDRRWVAMGPCTPQRRGAR
jgi:4-amino-4-deoxy-L-arabinose transferase-like glycosyltransferase